MRSNGNGMLVALSATWIIIKTVLAGLSCLSNPCIHGICIDDLNSTYSCYCIDGYTGIQCQTNWDECWSSPCKNGGICHDGIAAFNCTCPEGFVGETCEINYDECESNPCLNNGTCLDAANGYTCTCPPGYIGVHCEIDVAVCNVTGEARCSNGGLCIEGPGITFSCVCRPGWTGIFCQDAINECESGPCQNGGVCLDLHADYSCACPFGFTGKNCEEEIILCENNPCDNDALCLMEDSSSVCYCVPDYHGEKCQFQYDECQLGPRCMNGGTCIDGIDNFTCSCPPNLTGILCECFISDNDTLDCTYIRPTPYTTITYKTTATTKQMPTETTTKLITAGSSTETTPLVPNISTIHTSEITSTLSSISFTTFTIGTSTISVPETSELSSTTQMFTTELTHPIPTETTHLTSVATSSELTTNVTLPETTLPLEPRTESTELITVTDTSTTYTAELTTFITEHTKVTTASMPSTTSERASEETSNHYSTIISSTTFFTEEPTQTLPQWTTVETTTTEIPELDNVTILPMPDCSKMFCRNGGTCVLTAQGHKCICPFDAEGLLCETLLGIKHAAFNGQSHLSHKLTKTSKLEVELRAKTYSSAGILFYANNENTYMILYVQNGQLKFQFSCGFQTMLLSELEVPVNNGYEMDIHAKLEFSKDLKYCNASVKVNNTLSMSGDQIAFIEHFSTANSWLHLGGIPQEYVQDYVVTVPGFTGCMNNLKINGQTRNTFKDAQDGTNIKECSSLICLSDPCQNGATCVENDDKWHCQCRNGYVGNMCQQSVCENNPCLFGATCVPYTGSGYLCLCPYGKRGHFCEKDIEITSPSFPTSIQGLSSFSAYPVPIAITHYMELSFKFIPRTLEQISLLLFLGQNGLHDSASDHLAVSFVHGYVMLTWNLGAGPRRIFTTKPIQAREQAHEVRFGRFGRRAWLKVDDFGNITGRAPGKLVMLDVVPILYLGGHSTINFTTLPHDLPLHTGFSGCIFDVEIKTGALVFPIQVSKFAFGRSVGQCSMMECHERSCQNGGVCLQHGSTFTCMCQDGWYGPFCTIKHNPCNSMSHNCSEGSTCVPLVTGYECDCPIGKTGTFCEKNEMLSDVSLSGKRSFILLAPEQFDSYKFIIEFEMRPLSDRGLILFVGKTESTSFLSLLMQGSGLELKVCLGQRKTSHGDTLTVRSDKLLAMGVWHFIRIGVSGRRIMLSVDGIVNSGTLQAGEIIPLAKAQIYLGGLPDLSILPYQAMPAPTPYTGCLRKFHLNSNHLPLTTASVAQARNIADCDGTPCGGDVCLNGGTCWLDPSLKPQCACAEHFTGSRCEEQAPCEAQRCTKHGRCNDNTCVCTVGWSGAYCETEIEVKTPQFYGNSYLIVEKTKGNEKKRNTRRIKHDNVLQLNVSTANSEGLILWSEKDNDFFGVGLEHGYLKFVWSLSGGNTFIVDVPAVGHISDGTWHELEIFLDASNISLWVDRKLVYKQNTNKTIIDSFAINTRYFLGGLPQNMSIINETFGFFKSSFVGCIRSLAEQNSTGNDFVLYNGENIGNCDLF